MPSNVQLLTACTVIRLDGTSALCASKTVEIWSVASAAVVASPVTNASGLLPITPVPDPVGSTMILRILNVEGLCGCGAVTTV